MEFVSKYKSYKPDSNGLIKYSSAENEVWQTLYKRQVGLWSGRACQDYLDGLAALNLTTDEIPQLPQVSKILNAMTGWVVEPVAALISAREFFGLLGQRKFPAATFIRTMDELDYVQEPDIFHELVGHCPMLTNQVYADFMQDYAQMVLTFPEEDWPLLQRLFWFTVAVEFYLQLMKRCIALRVICHSVFCSALWQSLEHRIVLISYRMYILLFTIIRSCIIFLKWISQTYSKNHESLANFHRCLK